ncbi:unnamed protein product [Heligmosomoides polygyrus]|uniref:Uncharacterized protein n=1 Tax=Heligmosomoides polygyrus TaxID=6339 RepID=A0A183FID6_HELPZ|nr:unnamed protein product [Heligmosomoides polygyrus]
MVGFKSMRSICNQRRNRCRHEGSAGGGVVKVVQSVCRTKPAVSSRNPPRSVCQSLSAGRPAPPVRPVEKCWLALRSDELARLSSTINDDDDDGDDSVAFFFDDRHHPLTQRCLYKQHDTFAPVQLFRNMIQALRK